VSRNSDGATKTVGSITRELYRTAYSRTQIPLVVSYAANIHKVQSLTIDHGVAISLTDVFRSPGQLYVACSQVHSPHQIRFFGLGHRSSLEVGFDVTLTTFLANLTNSFE
jgi:hypothetical protein